jgi:hypothetical protein
MTRHLHAAVLATALLLAPPFAHALTARRVTVAELTRSADDVVVGTVRRSVSRWEGRFIVTDHEVELSAVLKGRLAPRAVVVVRVAGGVVGRIGQHVPGAPTLDDGRTYLLFLAGGVSDARYLAHMSAAVVPVTLDAAGRVQATAPESLAAGAPAMTLERLAGAVRAVAP